MLRNSQKDLVPRNGQTLEVCVVCRISGCQNQKEAMGWQRRHREPDVQRRPQMAVLERRELQRPIGRGSGYGGDQP